jgi:hypothetical protein
VAAGWDAAGAAEVCWARATAGGAVGSGGWAWREAVAAAEVARLSSWGEPLKRQSGGQRQPRMAVS